MMGNLDALAIRCSEADTAELVRALAAARRVFVDLGYFPDRRRAVDRSYFTVVDALATRTPQQQARTPYSPSTASRNPTREENPS